MSLRLMATYPATNLGNPSDPVDDLFYIVLSGQTNEGLYRETFDALKRAFPGWKGLSRARTSHIRRIIAKGGLSAQKARYIKAIARRLESDFGAITLEPLRALPDADVEEYLVTLPGVGIKSARCVMMYTFHREVFPADTNCLRVLERVGFIEWKGRRAESLAHTAQALVPENLRRDLHIDLVLHGRLACTPTNPLCSECALSDICRYAHPRPVKRPIVVDLCCGAGGFSWGFLQAGYEVGLGVDLSAYALDTYRLNIPGTKTLQLDVSGASVADEVLRELGEHHPSVVIAGPPCQGFSVAGTRDPADPRNSILVSAMRVAVAIKPDLIVFENVLNLRADEFVHHLTRAKRILGRAGYKYAHTTVDARSFGVAQARRRLLLVGSRSAARRDLRNALVALHERDHVAGATVATALQGLPLDPASNHWVYNHAAMNHSERVIQKITRIRPGTGPLSYRKLHPDRAAQTLICGHRALPCHFATPRTITVREAARLQGFPDIYKFVGPKGSQMLQVANAVPPKLALGIALGLNSLIQFAPEAHVNSLLDGILNRVHFRPDPSNTKPATRDEGGSLA